MKKAQENSTEVAVMENEIAVVEHNDEVQITTAEPISLEAYQATKEMLEKIKKDDFKHEIEITSEYLELEPGQEFKGIYAGVTEISSKYDKSNRVVNGKVKAARLMGIDEKMYILAAVVVVGTLEQYQAPCAVKIICTGVERSTNGEYQTFKISVLR